MNFHVKLAAVEEEIANLGEKGYRADSPLMRTLFLKRSRLVTKTAPDIQKMSHLELEAERATLLRAIKKAKRSSLLCNETLSMMRRRNLALKDAIEARKQKSSVVNMLQPQFAEAT